MIHGGKLRVNGTNGAIVALSKSCDITYQADTIEKSPQSDGTAKEYLPGMTGWKVSVSGLMSSVSTLLQVRSVYTLNITDGTSTVSGSAICTSVRQVGAVGNLAQQSVEFLGTGPLAAAVPSE